MDRKNVRVGGEPSCALVVPRFRPASTFMLPSELVEYLMTKPQILKNIPKRIHSVLQFPYDRIAFDRFDRSPSL